MSDSKRKSSRSRTARPLFPTPADCEAAFYDAFERADLNLLMAVWADDADIVCIHPNGPRLAGASAIRQSFSEIFAGGPTVHLRVSDLRRHQGQTLAIHCVYETLTPRGAPAPQSQDAPRFPPVLATNVYLLTPDGWRMIVHHASVSPEGTTSEEQGVARILH